MDPLIFGLLALIVVGIICAIVYQIPFPPPVAWMKWAIPCLALLIALVVILERMKAI